MSDVVERDYVRDLLDCLQIETVYSVDDRHAPDDEILVTIGRQLAPEQRAELLGREGEEETYREFDIFRSHLEELLPMYGETERTALVRRAQEMAGDAQFADDTVSLSKLGELLAERVEPLSKALWEERKGDILSADKPTLVLVDRDFRSEGGGETDGDDLIREIQQQAADKPIWTGLLTHTVSREREHETYLQLGDQGIDLQRMIVISKARVNPDEFASHLRLTLLAPLLRRLLGRAAKALIETTQTAADEAAQVLPVELESMVFGASYVEGVWPPETLMLLFELIQRDVARERILGDDEVRDLTNKVQCLGAVHAGLTVADRVAAEAEKQASDDAVGGQAPAVPRFYQRKQIYADGEIINRLHLPIECGDLFCNAAATSKRWVVIAQPCDLAVRADGVRGDFPITHVVLAPLKKLKAGQEPRPEQFKLPYFFEDTGQHAVAELNRARFQRLWLLDLAVFDASGVASLSIAAVEPPERLMTGWAARYARLRQDAEEVLAVASRNDEGLQVGLQLDPPADAAEIGGLAADVRVAISSDHANPPFTTKLDPASGTLDAGCQRVGRLTDEYARALLTRWGAHLSRPVLPYDLTRQPG